MAYLRVRTVTPIKEYPKPKLFCGQAIMDLIIRASGKKPAAQLAEYTTSMFEKKTGGTTVESFQTTFAKYGLKTIEGTLTTATNRQRVDRLVDALRKGHFVIITCKAPQSYNMPHWMAIVGHDTETDNFELYDPAATTVAQNGLPIGNRQVTITELLYLWRGTWFNRWYFGPYYYMEIVPPLA